MLNIKRILFLFFLGIVINLIDVNLGNAQNVKLKDFPNLRDANGPDFVRFAIPHGGATGPGQTILHITGHQKARRVDKMVRIFCTTNATHALQEISLKKRINFKGFNPLKQLVIFTHGFSENYFEQKSNFMYPAVETFLKYNEANVCILDWHRYATVYGYFLNVIDFRKKIGKYLSEVLLKFNELGVDFDDMVLVGHSVGAHVLGHAGYLLQGKVGTFIGLDPAGPYFCFPKLNSPSERLSTQSAKYVQTIVTSQNLMGCSHGLGHANFYINSGVFPQEACNIQNHLYMIHCAHYLASKIFTASMVPGMEFEGFTKYSNRGFKSKSDILGIKSKRRKGNFYVELTKFQTKLVE